jgi:hypothetical protein
MFGPVWPKTHLNKSSQEIHQKWTISNFTKVAVVAYFIAAFLKPEKKECC